MQISWPPVALLWHTVQLTTRTLSSDTQLSWPPERSPLTHSSADHQNALLWHTVQLTTRTLSSDTQVSWPPVPSPLTRSLTIHTSSSDKLISWSPALSPDTLISWSSALSPDTLISWPPALSPDTLISWRDQLTIGKLSSGTQVSWPEVRSSPTLLPLLAGQWHKIFFSFNQTIPFGSIIHNLEPLQICLYIRGDIQFQKWFSTVAHSGNRIICVVKGTEVSCMIGWDLGSRPIPHFILIVKIKAALRL